ncbi:MAG: hypothetical protein ABIH22_04520 [Candidatus Margulisiibacteriota bacterium]
MKYVRKLKKSGKYTYAVTLPMSFVKKLRWRIRQKVVLTVGKKGIYIRDWKKGS